MLADVTNTFTLVRLGWTKSSNLSRRLSNLLFIGASNYDLGLDRCFHRNAIGQVVDHRMRETQAEV